MAVFRECKHSFLIVLALFRKSACTHVSCPKIAILSKMGGTALGIPNIKKSLPTHHAQTDSCSKD